jgi:hypothetical protein
MFKDDFVLPSKAGGLDSQWSAKAAKGPAKAASGQPRQL